MSTAASNIQYPDRLDFALSPTPLQYLSNLSKELDGPRLWVKRDDLTGSHLSGNKVRKLEFLFAQARALGADTIITCGGVQSNHCRATALLAVQAGFKCHLLLRGDEPELNDGNLLLDRLAGATISFYPSHSFESRLGEYFSHWQQHYFDLGRKAYAIPTGGSNATGLWGYLRCAEELTVQCAAAGFSANHWVTATGSGGTQAGLTLGAAILSPATCVTGMAVCDDSAYFARKVGADIVAWAEEFAELSLQNTQSLPEPLNALPVTTNDRYIGPGYALAGPEIYQTIKRVAATEGLLLDPVYTAKAFHGMLAEIDSGAWANADDIVFVHTGGVFGLFPHKQHFIF